MSVSLTFNPDHSRTLDRAVRRIDVSVGPLIVTATDDPEVIPAEESRDYDGVASLTLYSPNGAIVSVTYADEPLPEDTAPRGDSGGTGGSFESRTVKELRTLAAERDIAGASKLRKAELIKALRG
ncbi:MAG TPA: Rho termination factor N-terminal domain-containing protein [Blastocatellia bacterium]|nr:Rho termination factor N-terminal domain-containing protein [Blastocatellia bacterium]